MPISPISHRWRLGPAVGNSRHERHAQCSCLAGVDGGSQLRRGAAEFCSAGLLNFRSFQAAQVARLRGGRRITSLFRKGTVPFSLRENWDSPQIVFRPTLSGGSRPAACGLGSCRGGVSGTATVYTAWGKDISGGAFSIVGACSTDLRGQAQTPSQKMPNSANVTSGATRRDATRLWQQSFILP